jgi:hypothetical protein
MLRLAIILVILFAVFSVDASAQYPDEQDCVMRDVDVCTVVPNAGCGYQTIRICLP